MFECAFPFQKYPVVTMAHGAGGRFTRHLIDDVFNAAFGTAETGHDGFVYPASGNQVITTDSYVVRPLFFPGGDIGTLAVTGSCNDLAVCGAEPLYMTCGCIIEEGFETKDLFRVASSMAAAARYIGVRIVTGDIKVVEKGHGDGIYINTTGVGRQIAPVHPSRIQTGDAVIVSGDLGRHGAAVLTQREGLEIAEPIESDVEHLWPRVNGLLSAGIDVHCLRDLTRGGLGNAIAEIADSTGHQVAIEEGSLPVDSRVRSVCELYGLDPVYTANEGRMVVILPQADTEPALELLGTGASVIGEVTAGEGAVIVTRFGVRRVLDPLSGEQLPRVC